MLDILTIVYNFADTTTAARMRQICRKLSVLVLQPIRYIDPLYHYSENAVCEYRVGGKLHRLDGPAVEYEDGSIAWYREGRGHREYHPQYISEYDREYKIKNKFHREVGPSRIHGECEFWVIRGLTHRKVGPAYRWRHTGHWYTQDSLHRLDGPSDLGYYRIRGIIHRISAPMSKEWIVNGVRIRL